MNDEILATHPATRIGKLLPKRPQRPEIYPLTREELTHLLTTIQTHRPQHLPLFLTLARTGMRLGEALGLPWEDIDWHSRVVHVQRSYTSGRITTPKNGKTRRGESLVYIRDQLGHHSISLTVDTYGHLVPGGNRQAVDKLDDASECNPRATITL